MHCVAGPGGQYDLTSWQMAPPVSPTFHCDVAELALCVAGRAPHPAQYCTYLHVSAERGSIGAEKPRRAGEQEDGFHFEGSSIAAVN